MLRFWYPCPFEMRPFPALFGGPMHVAMIGQKGIPARMGGIERHVEELSAHLASQGVEVTVYTRPWYAPAGRTRHRGVRLVSLPSVRTKHLDAVTHTIRATIHAMRSDADVLHYHGVGPALLAWIPRVFAPGKRVVVTFHCIDRRHEKWGLVARLALAMGEVAACKFAHETVAVSRTLQHYAENLYRRDVRYVPNGVGSLGKGGVATLRTMGLEPGSYLLVVTRFVRHKGIHTVLAAWERVQRDPRMRGLSLVLVGGSSFTDSYVEEIQEFAGRLERVRLMGVKEGEQLAALHRHARLFVHASVSEGLPLVVLEAMHAGAPVLASDIPEHMELVAEHGFRFRSGDAKDLARAIVRIVGDRERAAAKAVRAKAWVRRSFRWEDIAEETVGVYEDAFRRDARRAEATA